MRIPYRIAAALLALGAAPWASAQTAAAQGGVTVSFQKPERYTDASATPATQVTEDSPSLKGLAAYIKTIGASQLGPDDRLDIVFTDVDLAGRIVPLPNQQRDVRMLSSDSWPRLKFHYLLTRGGVQQEGDESLADMNYLQTGRATQDSDPLRYEKLMLDQWLRVTLAQPR